MNNFDYEMTMKPTIPQVPLPVWRDLYSAAQQFQNLRPWEVLDDLDLVGVRDTSGGETGYAAVMGSGGTLFGLCVYRGAEGFNVYRKLVSGESDPYEDDAFAIQNCLKLELGARNDLQAEDLAVIRRLGLGFKGKHGWPEFRSLMPGYLPWFLREPEARFMTLALNAVCRHCEQVRQRSITESFRESDCLVYSAKGGTQTEFDVRWEAVPVPEPVSFPPPVLNLARINAIRARNPKRDSPWEADVFYLPSTISEGERPYFTRMAAVCQQASGFSFAFDIIRPELPATQALADTICASVERHGFLPDTIFVKSAAEANALAPLGKALGVSIYPEKRLETIRFLKKELETHMRE